MSSDEIFAAHMWPWPDPMIKRNAQGGVLFVNAAFLKMYGGQVADWQGNTVAGWPVPNMSSVPNRFETRINTAEGEKVYDWIEYTLADGGTLGIARDVSALLSPPEPDPAHTMMPPQAPQMTAPPAAAAVHATQTPVAATAFQGQAQAEVCAVEAAAMQTPAAAFTPPPADDNANAASAALGAAAVGAAAIGSMAAQAPEAIQTPAVEIPAIEVPEIEIPKFEASEFSAPDTSAPDTSAPAVETAPIATEAPAAELAAQPVQTSAPLTPERDYERRALPIEDNEAVLGTNWRDAVIAKAVGGSLPKAEEAEPEPEEAAPVAEKKEGEPLTVLLAEDNAINALLTRTLLEADGCSVDVVEDGALAVEAMKHKFYDMIFMDMRMPNMDGLESTRKIRALPNVPKSLPIVALTANAFDDDRNACFDSGMNDFMTKPVSAEELSEMVNRWARKKETEAA